MTKDIECAPISWNRVIAKVPTDDALEPRPHLPYRLIHSRAKRGSDSEQSRPKPFAARFASNRKRTVRTALFADMDLMPGRPYAPMRGYPHICTSLFGSDFVAYKSRARRREITQEKHWISLVECQ
jgi:hypothetical protein